MYFLMKFQNYILILAGCLLAACSNDDDPVKTIEAEPDATLSLIVDNGEDASLRATKAEIIYDDIDKDIYSLTLAVFNQGAYEDRKIGELVACKTAIDENGTCDKIENLEVHSGPVDVLILGHVPDHFELVVGKTMLSDVIEEVQSVSLEDEEERLTMGSAVHRVILQSEKVNCMGYSDQDIEKENSKQTSNKYISVFQSQGSSPRIKMYRNVARIQLNSIKFQPLPEYANDAELTINNLFVANVKSKTRLTAADEWGDVEWTTPTVSNEAEKFWYCGRFADAEGVLKQGGATEYDLLSVNLINRPSNGGKENKDKIVILKEGQSCDAAAREGGVIGKTFYVYENTEEQTNHTLLVLSGTYKYIPTYQTEPKILPVYYAVTVNKPGEGKLDGGTVEPYIKRNYNYSVNVIIKAPGSKDPYNPEVSANLSTSVEVLPWNVVIIDEEVE